MPELDYALVAEHVRIDRGLAYVTAANIDTLTADQVPAPWNLGLLIGLRQLPDEPPIENAPVEITLRNEAGERLLEVQGAVTVPERPAELPAEWPMRAMLALNLGFVAPNYGTYFFDIAVEGEVRRTLPLRVIPAGQDAPASA